MNAILQSQLDRVEAALNSLSDSITSYNPSLPAAQELLDADAAFQKGIGQLTRHQRNYAYILSLRAKADSLSQSLTSSLSLLASTRSEILSTSAPALPPLSNTGETTSKQTTATTRRPVPHAELLAVARNQARSAAPLNYLPPSAQAATAAAATTSSNELAQTQTSTLPNLSQAQQQQSQSQTPHTQTQTSPTDTPMPDASTQQQQQQQQQQPAGISSFATDKTTSTNPGLLALPESELLWLDPLTQTPYLPWPSEDMIARSSLARVQGWAGAVVDEEDDNGGGAAAQGPPGAESGGLPGLGVEGMEVEGAKREEGPGGQGQVLQPPPPPMVKEEKPKVFGSLDLWDPDEE